jgi:RNA polymerase sigma-70 factor (ECF subfamily)
MRPQTEDKTTRPRPHTESVLTSVLPKVLFGLSATSERSGRPVAADIMRPMGPRGMGPGELSDEELLAEYATRSGVSRDAIENELFERHYERVARWCLRFTGDREAAADLAQDVFLKAHRHLGSFKRASRFSTWLYTIVRNESLNRIQGGGPHMDTEEVLAEAAALEAGPEELAERGSQGKRLRDFLATTLDRVERTVFTLHYGDDMTLDDITRLLKLDNASGAKAYIVSARRKLAKATQRLRARGDDL